MYIFVVSSLGHLDTVMPIVISMKHRNASAKFMLVYRSRKVAIDINKSVFLSDIIAEYIDKTICIDLDSGLAWKLYSFIRIIALCFRNIFRKNIRMIHSASINGPIMRSLYMFCKLSGGKSYGMFSCQVPNIGRLPTRIKKKDCGDGFLAFSIHDKSFLNAHGIRKIYYIGYPRLYNEWVKIVTDKSKQYFNKELKLDTVNKNKVKIFVLLGSIVPRLYSKEEFHKWLVEVLEVIRKKFENHVVIIKPHPKLDIENIHKAINSVSKINALITNLHTSIVALESFIVISHHTTAVLDALQFNNNTILYMQLTEHWLKIDPTLCKLFSQFVPRMASTKEDLHSHIENILSGEVKGIDLIELLEHKKNLNILK